MSRDSMLVLLRLLYLTIVFDSAHYNNNFHTSTKINITDYKIIIVMSRDSMLVLESSNYYCITREYCILF